MNKLIEEFAKQATREYSPTYYRKERIQRFAALVAAAEREECANLVYQRCIEWFGEENRIEVQNAIDYAEEIRARG